MKGSSGGAGREPVNHAPLTHELPQPHKYTHTPPLSHTNIHTHTYTKKVGSVLSAFPTMISITLAVVFFLIGMAYRSAIAPLRCVVACVSIDNSYVTTESAAPPSPRCGALALCFVRAGTKCLCPQREVPGLRTGGHRSLPSTHTLTYIYLCAHAHTHLHTHSSVLTIALTLGVVYGLAILVYQHGGLDALGVRSLSQVRKDSQHSVIICFGGA